MWTSIEDNYLSLWNKHLQDEKPDITFSKDKLDKLILKSPEKQVLITFNSIIWLYFYFCNNSLLNLHPTLTG